MKPSRLFAVSATASAVFAGLALGGCATAAPKSLAASFVPPKTMALLPVANASPDVNCPEMVRSLFQQALADRGYNVMEPAKTDEVLTAKFATADGNQLKNTEAGKLGESLGVEALMYGSIVTCKSFNVGLYSNKEVEIDFKLVDARTGQTLWEQQKNAWDKALAVTAETAAVAAVHGVMDKYSDWPLSGTAQKAVRWTIASLPHANGSHSSDTSKSSSSHTSTTTTVEEDETK
ncbi:MAG: GNA1162 family protein [Elusimicrobiota bacterium]